MVMESITGIVNIIMRTPVFQLFFLIGGLWVIFLWVSLFLYNKTSPQQALDTKLATLFFEQHLFLFQNKDKLFAYEKVKELLFLQKIKFFQEPFSKKNKEKCYTLALKDLQYAKELIK